MSLRSTAPFKLSSFPVDELESGSSVLITGEDRGALADVFGGLMLPEPDHDEQSVLVGTNNIDNVVSQIKDENRQAASGVRVIAEETHGLRQPDVTAIDDLGDMTALGMHLSDTIGDIQQSHDRFRAGIFLCSDICQSVDDIRSVYRFINTSFLSELRRNDAIGAAAVQTNADIQTDTDSMVKSMASSFDIHLAIESVSRREITVTVDGWRDAGSELTISR